MPIRTLVFFCCFGINLVMSLDCLPHGSTLCTKEPLCCNSGYFYNAECSGCRECMKAEGEECGGEWDLSGLCAPRLRCQNSTQYNPGTCVKVQHWDPPSPKLGLRKAPKCDGLKEGFCSCALEDQPDHNKNCKPIDFFGEGEEGKYGYCFLENIQDFKNPTKNCHADTKWSVTHSRFYSYKACENYTPYQNKRYYERPIVIRD